MKNRTIKGKRYLMVPSIRMGGESGSCDHCVFANAENGYCDLVEGSPEDDPRYSSPYLIGCQSLDDYDEDFIFIKTTKAALAEYIAKKLEGT